MWCADRSRKDLHCGRSNGGSRPRKTALRAGARRSPVSRRSPVGSRGRRAGRHDPRDRDRRRGGRIALERRARRVGRARVRRVPRADRPARTSGLSIRLVGAAVALQTLVAVVRPPARPQDLWWYAIYGRILAMYHASPYTHVAAPIPAQPAARAGRATRGDTRRRSTAPRSPRCCGVASLVLGTSLLGRGSSTRASPPRRW